MRQNKLADKVIAKRKLKKEYYIKELLKFVLKNVPNDIKSHMYEKKPSHFLKNKSQSFCSSTIM